MADSVRQWRRSSGFVIDHRKPGAWNADAHVTRISASLTPILNYIFDLTSLLKKQSWFFYSKA